jgi:hypothetical protein
MQCAKVSAPSKSMTFRSEIQIKEQFKIENSTAFKKQLIIDALNLLPLDGRVSDKIRCEKKITTLQRLARRIANEERRKKHEKPKIKLQSRGKEETCFVKNE